MPPTISAIQIESILALSGPDRYAHFVKVVADREEIWGLYDDGWASALTDDGGEVFPIWPTREYAALCAEEEWCGYAPQSISLGEFMDVLLPQLSKDGILPAVFFTPSGNGVTPTVAELVGDLEEELAKY